MTDEELEAALDNLRIETGPQLDDRIITAASSAFGELSAPVSSQPPHLSWRPANAPTPRIGPGSRLQHVHRGFWAAVAVSLVVVLSCVTILISWTSEPRLTWPEIVQAVGAKPWVNATVSLPRGETEEYWFSRDRDLTAIRIVRDVEITDLRKRLQFRYSAADRVLYRTGLSAASWSADFPVLDDAVRVLFNEENLIGLALAGANVVEQEIRVVVDDGRDWVEFELTLQQHLGSKLGKLVCRVDPQTRLPHSWISRPWQESSVVGHTAQFQYPEKGPLDPYSLGVPRNVKVVELQPHTDVPIERR